MSIVAGVFLFWVVAYLPWMAWRSGRHVSTGKTLPSRTRLYQSAVLVQAVLMCLAWFTARAEWIELFPPPRIGAIDAAIGLGWVAVKLMRFGWVVRHPEWRGRRRMLGYLAPRTGGEIAFYVGVVACAAVAEEAAYRGVLFQLAERASGSFWIAGIAAAVVFGLGHLTQGRRPALVAGVLGFGNQLVVLWTGSLWVAIAAHFAYDIAVGLWVGIGNALGTQEPVETTPV